MRVVSFCYFLFTTSAVVGELVDPRPQNKAVAKGATRVALNCSSTLQDGWRVIGWNTWGVGEANVKSIASGDFVLSAYRDTYNVSNAGAPTSTLTIIKTVTESLAGTYSCSESGVAATASAQLIVYNSDPVCTSSVSSPLYQGQTVQMSCSFSYTANKANVGINMTWSFINGGSSSPVQSPYPVITTAGSRTTAVSTITQTVGYSNSFPVYQCKTSFTVTGNTATNAAGNVPDYSNTTRPFNSPITVNYFNPSCSINGAKYGDRVLFGTTIRCEVDANPPPSYRWSNETNASLSSEKSVAITDDGRYTCTASNAVGRCTVSIILTTYTTTSPPTTTIRTTSSTYANSRTTLSTGASSGNNANVVIGVVVGIGLPVLVIVLIIVTFYCVRKKRAEDRVKSESPSAQGPQRQTAIGLQTNFENATTYEKLTGSPAQRAQIYTSLQLPGQVENPAMNVEPYETLTDRTDEQPHEYGRLRFPLEYDNPATTNTPEYSNLSTR